MDSTPFEAGVFYTPNQGPWLECAPPQGICILYKAQTPIAACCGKSAFGLPQMDPGNSGASFPKISLA